MKAAWTQFKEEELPLIRTNLKSDTASIATEALKQIQQLTINNDDLTNYELLFNIIGFKPTSNKWIPDEESQLISWARLVEEHIGKLLTKVEQNLNITENSKNSTIFSLHNPDHQSSTIRSRNNLGHFAYICSFSPHGGLPNKTHLNTSSKP